MLVPDDRPERYGPPTLQSLWQADDHRAAVRDDKNKRNGWSLRDTQITKPDRLDRLLLIMAIAYLLLCGLGIMAKEILCPSDWCSTNRPNECSIFTIGLIMLQRLKPLPPSKAFAAVLALSEEVMENWG